MNIYAGPDASLEVALGQKTKLSRGRDVLEDPSLTSK